MGLEIVGRGEVRVEEEDEGGKGAGGGGIVRAGWMRERDLFVVQGARVRGGWDEGWDTEEDLLFDVVDQMWRSVERWRRRSSCF